MKAAGFAISLMALLATVEARERIDPGRQRALMASAATLIEARYVDPDKARTIAGALRDGGPVADAALEPEAFARLATERLRAISGDGHLGMSYSAAPIPATDGEAAFSREEMEKWYGPQLNHGIEKIERLPGNIMLLDLRVFPPTDMGGDAISAAMTTVAQGSALILDLRNNAGGEETSNLLIGYLAKPGSPLSGSYNRPSDTTVHATTPVWVPGRRFGEHKPLYVLTSHGTFSAGERVAYDLQALGRAVIVGETTGGGANPFEYRRIAEHFALNLPESRSINPITGSNWEGVGVKPDVEVPADKALETALELARKAITSSPGG